MGVVKQFKGDYKQLIAWQKARVMVKAFYEFTARFPKEETYGLTSQIRRAAISVPSNIAQGHARTTSREYAHFLSIAYGSATELETLIYLSYDIGYIKDDKKDAALSMIEEILKIVGSLRHNLKNEP
ncbi:MAG: four helix bundle protein [Alphaproteobacteria bacterium]|nr:four helix bundle protein [Alphaproteobacteria bacterium]